MSFTEDEIIQILKLIEQSTFDELQLEAKDLKLIVKKAVGQGITYEDNNIFKPSAILEPSDSKQQAELTVQENEIDQQDGNSGENELVTIKAPLLGIFYRKPEPGAPPFVDIGTFVDEDTTVCLIEVMKVFNTVKAGVKGYIKNVCVESGELVEYGQPLFLVKPL